MGEATEGTTQVTGFGTMPDGTPVDLYTVWDGNAHASFTSFGARLVSVSAADRRGRLAEVVLGYDSLAMYLADAAFLGATIGRYGNRIAGGKFTLDGREYTVPLNNGSNALHGGPQGFDQKVWAAQPIEHGVEFQTTSPDGEMGFPGTMQVRVRYTFAGGSLRIDYHATCDQDTVLNLTNHAYFNLQGERSADVGGHRVRVPAEHYTQVDAQQIPTGVLAPVEGTPFDLRTPTEIRTRWDLPDPQMQRGGGFDHTFAFGHAGTMKLVAQVTEPASGRTLTVQTTEPGVQFYSGNSLDGKMPDRNGSSYRKRHGFCLETQHYPDSPNQPDFPSTVLRAGETFHSTTIYTFSAGADGA